MVVRLMRAESIVGWLPFSLCLGANFLTLLVRILRYYGTAERTVYLPYHRIALVAPVLF
jgi:hypothetical protein